MPLEQPTRNVMSEVNENGHHAQDPGILRPDNTGGGPRSRAWRMGVLVTGITAVLVLAWFLRQGADNPNAPPSDDMLERVRAAELDKVKQKAIWDAEHVTFRIENRFGKPILAAVVAGSPADIVPYARPGFRAIVRSAVAPVKRQQAGVSEEKTENEIGDGPDLDAETFSHHLVRSLNRGGKIESTRFQLLQIKQQEDPVHWWAQAFITIRGPGYIIEGVHACEFRFSEETDFAKQPILVRWQVEEESYRRTDKLIFEETTDLAGLAQLPLRDNWKLEPTSAGQYQFQCAVSDYDRDGYLDIAIATYQGQPYLLRGDRGGRFVDVTAQMGLKSWESTGRTVNSLAGWIDVDGDNFPDLVLGRYIYENQQGRGFRENTAETGVHFNREPMGMCVADFDCDGRLDFYIPYQLEDPDAHKGEIVPWIGDNKSGVPNALWHNQGGGKFKNVAVQAGAAGGKGKSFAASWFFYDQDTYPDLYIANDFGSNILLQNRGDGTFKDISETSRASDYATSMGVASGDLDNDGIPELYVANMYSKMGRRIIGQVGNEDYPEGIFSQIQGSCAGSRLYRRKTEDSVFVENSLGRRVNTVGWAYGPAFLDVDNDGQLDLYATTGFMSFDRRKPDG